MWEGNVCALGPSPCTSFYANDLGAQAFGPLAGLMSGGTPAEKMWTVGVNTSNPKIIYVISGKGMTDAQFRSYSAAMHKFS